jgi:hypothetical protein
MEPDLRAVEPDHWARCHRIGEIPLTPLPRRVRAGAIGRAG